MALDSSRAILGVARSIGDEPFLISQLVRIAEVSAALATIERVLAQGVASDAALERVQRGAGDGGENELHAPRPPGRGAGTFDMFAKFRSGEISAAQLGGGPTSMAFGMLVRVGSLSTNASAMMLERLNRAVAISRVPLRDQQPLWKEWDDGAAGPGGILDFSGTIVRMTMPAIRACADADLRMHALLGAGIATIAAERHRLAVGRWPERVEDLKPSYLASLPEDPYGTGFVKIVRRGDGPTVYVIGSDRFDNRGNTSTSRGRPVVGPDLGYRLFDVDHRRRSPPELPADVFANEDPGRLDFFGRGDDAARRRSPSRSEPQAQSHSPGTFPAGNPDTNLIVPPGDPAVETTWNRGPLPTASYRPRPRVGPIGWGLSPTSSGPRRQLPAPPRHRRGRPGRPELAARRPGERTGSPSRPRRTPRSGPRPWSACCPAAGSIAFRAGPVGIGGDAGRPRPLWRHRRLEPDVPSRPSWRISSARRWPTRGERAAAARRLANMGEGYFPLKYSNIWISTLLPHIQESRNVARLLQLDATAAEAGDADGALESCRATLGVGPFDRRRADRHLASWSAWPTITWPSSRPNASSRGGSLPRPRWQPPATSPAKRPSHSSSTASAASRRDVRPDREARQRRDPSGGPPWADGTSADAYLQIPMHVGVFNRHNQAVLLDFMNRGVAICRRPGRRAAAGSWAEWQRATQPGGGLDQYISILAHSLKTDLKAAADTQLRTVARLRAARVAIAIERFRLANRRWPDRLDELVPRFPRLRPGRSLLGRAIPPGGPRRKTGRLRRRTRRDRRWRQARSGPNETGGGSGRRVRLIEAGDRRRSAPELPKDVFSRESTRSGP